MPDYRARRAHRKVAGRTAGKWCYCREARAGRSCDRSPRREARLSEDPSGQLSAGLHALGGRTVTTASSRTLRSTRPRSLATARCRYQQPQTRWWRW
eukprot:scaffold41121_cov71-Phaeocystis_antarctica.AAC.3